MKKEKLKVKLEVSANAVPEKILLEFLKCYRKRKFTSEVQAESSKMLIDKTLSSYYCQYCNNYHLGHGDGNAAKDVALANAKKKWSLYPQEANEISKKYSLI